MEEKQLPDLSRIVWADLKRGLQIDAVYSPRVFSGIEEHLSSGVGLSLNAELDDDQVLIDGSLKVSLKTECARCLAEAFLSKDIAVDTCVSAEGKYFDFIPVIEEEVLLAMELKSVCRSDCRGLCSLCGVNLNNSSCVCEKSSLTNFVK